MESTSKYRYALTTEIIKGRQLGYTVAFSDTDHNLLRKEIDPLTLEKREIL